MLWMPRELSRREIPKYFSSVYPFDFRNENTESWGWKETELILQVWTWQEQNWVVAVIPQPAPAGPESLLLADSVPYFFSIIVLPR